MTESEHNSHSRIDADVDRFLAVIAKNLTVIFTTVAFSPQN